MCLGVRCGLSWSAMSGQLSLDNWFAKGTPSVDPAKPLGDMQRFAPPEKRCIKKYGRGNRCKWWFLASDPHSECPKCQRVTKRGNASEAGKARAKRHNSSEAGKKAKKLYSTSEAGKACKKRYETSEKGKAAHKRANTSDAGKKAQKRYKTSPAGKASAKRAGRLRMNRLSQSLRKMVKGVHKCPKTFRELGIFVDNADAEAFFESTKTEPWMKDAPWGNDEETTEPKAVLQIGHKIPKSWYRHDDELEIKKAWSRRNLFAQCAVENHKAGDRNFLTREEWLALKNIWPKQCTGMTDEEAWIWARDNVDNATRKKKRKRDESQATTTSQYASD